MKLVHVLVYFPCRVLPPSRPDDAVFYNALVDVENKWNQGHPMHFQGKDYVLVHTSVPAIEGSSVGRFRFFLVRATRRPTRRIEASSDSSAGVPAELPRSR